MALDKKVIATLPPKMQSRLQEFSDDVEAAERAKDAPTPVADFVKAGELFLGKVDGTEIEGSANVIGEVKKYLDALRPKMEVRPRQAGDLLASLWQGMIDQDSLEDDAVEPVKQLLARWSESKPAGSSGDTEPPKDLGYRVWSFCDAPGCKWESYTQKDNHNSARNACLKHSEEDHHLIINKASKSPRYAQIGDALNRVGIGAENEVAVAARKDALDPKKPRLVVQDGGYSFVTTSEGASSGGLKPRPAADEAAA